VELLAPLCAAIVIVDVFSFSTALDVALSRGASVLPYRWKDDSAQAFALSKGAPLAGKRSSGGFSLSPASLESLPHGSALVLPSPNGSTLSLGTGQTPTFSACLRNAPAVARRLPALGSPIAVIAAGETWSGGALRPCVEDLAGAGAVLAEIGGSLSPEAELAVAAFERFRQRLPEVLGQCASGQELIQRGFTRDVELAAEYGSSECVPMLREDRFVNGAAGTLG